MLNKRLNVKTLLVDSLKLSQVLPQPTALLDDLLFDSSSIDGQYLKTYSRKSSSFDFVDQDQSSYLMSSFGNDFRPFRQKSYVA